MTSEEISQLYQGNFVRYSCGCVALALGEGKGLQLLDCRRLDETYFSVRHLADIGEVSKKYPLEEIGLHDERVQKWIDRCNTSIIMFDRLKTIFRELKAIDTILTQPKNW